MTKKFYAVKAGYAPGIYESWDECKKQVDGFSGASYKGFVTRKEAEEFLRLAVTESTLTFSSEALTAVQLSEAVAYVDGSYDDAIKAFAYGVVMFYDGVEEHFSAKMDNPELIEMHNVAGEIKAAEKAMQFCVVHGIKSIDIYHDYEGIAKWCTGEWQANKLGTKSYKEFYDNIKGLLKVNFYKVAAHTGDTYNELADQIAKSALHGKVIIDSKKIKEDIIEMVSSKSIYIEQENIDQLISEIGAAEWADFSAQPLCKVGNQERCAFNANGKNAKLDFYFKNDGTTTIKATGANTELSTKLAELIETHGYKNDHKNSSCTFNFVDESNCLQLIEYLKSIDKIEVIEETRVESPAHNHFKFKSSFGDSMVINHYDTGKLLFQGNPAYLFTEALYFMSLSPDVSLNEIIERKNETYKSTITVDGARAELKQRIPHIYDKLDDTILKLLSPSIALSTSGIEVEDYSCYVFPAFKALEQLLLNLLSENGRHKGVKDSFSKVFYFDNIAMKQKLKLDPINPISDVIFIQTVEDIYNYFNGNRNVYFHANEILMLTGIIEDRLEADTMLNQILIYFDDVGLKNLK